MIYYVVSANEAGAFRFFVRMYMPSLVGRVTALPYWRLALQRRLLPGTYIFTQIETMPRILAEPVARICSDLRGRPEFRVLNQPGRSLGRYDLLCALHREGLNTFQPFRLDPQAPPPRFPVFIRQEHDHHGSLSRLLHSPEEFRAAARAAGPDAGREEKSMVVEFCNTADAQGIYRKYSVVAVGDRLVPRHLFFCRTWMTKHVGATLSDAQVDEERQFIDQNPHADQLRRIFALADIQYGRIDYAVLDGKVQTWEINSNPRLASAGDFSNHPQRMYVQQRFGERMRAAFEALDLPAAGAPHDVGWRKRATLARIVMRCALRQRQYRHEKRAMRKRFARLGLDPAAGETAGAGRS